MSESEIDTFIKIQKDYIEHLKLNPNCLLAKIFGVFTLNLSGMGSVHVMLMENTLQHKDIKNLNFTFDLKGSKTGRFTTGKINPSTV